jgi:hypothetical protein
MGSRAAPRWRHDVREDPLDSNAARLGDHHLCPEHVGEGVLPACASTILLEGSPAARVGDQLTCQWGPSSTRDIAAGFIREGLPGEEPIDVGGGSLPSAGASSLFGAKFKL